MVPGGFVKGGFVAVAVALAAACHSPDPWESDEFSGTGGAASGGKSSGGAATGGRQAGGARSSGGARPSAGGAPSSGGTPASGGASSGGAGAGGNAGAGTGGAGTGGGGNPVAPHPGKLVSYPSQTAYQRGEQRIRVLLPSGYDAARKYRVLYVLPVEAGNPILFGDGIGTLQSMDAHEKYDLIIVEPSFALEPWLGDHAADAAIRQASYMVEQVVPFIERGFSVVPEPASRLLIGFSKGGWAAFSLILKYPEFFGYAAAWDSPLMFDTFQFGMKSVFGTPEQLDAFRPDLLAQRNAAAFAGAPRLVLTGENVWGASIPPPTGKSHTVQFHTMLEAVGVPHVYDDDLYAFHNWNATWAEPTLAKLMEIAEPGTAPSR